MKLIHYFPGRIRLEVTGILGRPEADRRLIQNLLALEGIREAAANPYTGRLLIRYDTRILDIRTLKKLLFLNLKALTSGVRKKTAEAAATLEPQQAHKENSTGGEPLAKTAGAMNLPPYRTNNTNGLGSRDLLTMLDTDSRLGLSWASARERLAYYGPNALPSPPQPTITRIFIRTLTESYMSKVLLGLGGFSLVMGKTANAFMSIGVLVANTVMAVAQERRTQNSLKQLNNLITAKAWVLRDGRPLSLEAKALVPGDIIVLEAGEKVPADACLLQASQLVVEEASLTGESAPVVKDAAQPNQAPAIYMGTSVLSGKAQAVVTATGQDTEMGRISRTLKTVPVPSPFHQRLDEVFHTLVNGGLGISGTAVLAGLWHRQPFGGILENATGLAVSFIPDALAPIVTLTTALGAMRLSRKHVALRQFPAIDTLGCTTVICCDKTGTLTRNQIEVQEVRGSGLRWNLAGERFAASLGRQPESLQTGTLRRIFHIAALCNNAVLQETPDGRYRTDGESTECALLIGGRRAGFSAGDEGFTRLEEIPFRSETMYMAVVGRDDQDKTWSLVKGAPDVVLERCTQVLQGNTIKRMTPADTAEIAAEIAEMSGRALRVLAMAYKPWEAGEAPDQGLILAGLIGMIDPPRPEAKEFVARCREAGVKVVMITGDHRETALAIARQLGIEHSPEGVLTGPEIKQMSGEELALAAGKVSLFARTSPGQKQTLVRALKKQGQIVTMVGDGVNDVPAMKEAHLGAAMAASGTPVARESSGVALTNDNINGLLEAIQEGRNVYANIRQALRYMITTNFGDGVVILLTSILGSPIPLTPVQLLWVNATSDPYISWSLANFPPAPESMRHPPRKPNAGIFGQGLGRQIITRSLLIGLSAYMVYSRSLKQGENIELTRTKTMAALSLGRLFHVTDFRRRTKRSGQKSPNQRLEKGSLIMVSCLLGAAYIPGLRKTLKTAPLRPDDWLPVLAWASAAYIADLGINNALTRKYS